MILSAQTIRQRCQDTQNFQTFRDAAPQDMIIRPFSEAKQALGMSYGLSSCGYDIRVGKIGWESIRQSASGDRRSAQVRPLEALSLKPGDFLLCSSLEYMRIPTDVAGKVHDKSTLARQGLALQNTILEPGWCGYITLELSNHSCRAISIRVGQPIAQVVFELLDAPTELPYVGKYQNQPDRPVEAILVPDEIHGDATGAGSLVWGVEKTVPTAVASRPVRGQCDLCGGWTRQVGPIGGPAWRHNMCPADPMFTDVC